MCLDPRFEPPRCPPVRGFFAVQGVTVADADLVAVVCGLCGESLLAHPDRTRYVASNHALDFHRVQLAADPEATMAAFTVAAARKPAPAL